MKKERKFLKQKPLTAGLVVFISMLTLSNPLYAYNFKQTHKQQGVECKSCHGNDKKAIIPNETCLACHGSFAELSEKTADMHRNPHMGPHFLDVECTSCHQGHDVIYNLCQDCHGPISRHEKK